MAIALDPSRAAADDPSRTATATRLPAWAAGAALLAVLGGLRLGGRELWLDEAYSQAAVHDLAGTVTATGGTMAAYYALLTPWSWIDDSPAWLRAPSLALMIAAIALTSAFVGRVAGRRAAMWTALVAAATPAIVVYATEARSYALVCVLAATAWYALDRVLEDEASAWRWAYLGATVLLPLAHGLGTIQAVAAGVAVVAARPSRRTIALLACAAMLTVTVLAAMYLLGIEGVGVWVEPLTVAGAATFVRMLLHPTPALALVVAVLAAIGAAHCWRAGGATPLDRFRRVALVCWGPGTMAAILVLSLARPSQVPRYGVTAALAVAGLAGIAIAQLGQRPIERLAPIVLVAAMVVTMPPADAGQGWAVAARRVADDGVGGDQVVFGGPDARVPFEAAWSQLDAPSTPTVLDGAGPLGSFDRFWGEGETAALLGEVVPTERVWVVQVDGKAPEVTGLRRALVASAGFEQVDRWSVDGRVELWLFAPRK